MCVFGSCFIIKLPSSNPGPVWSDVTGSALKRQKLQLSESGVCCSSLLTRYLYDTNRHALRAPYSEQRGRLCFRWPRTIWLHRYFI